MIKSLRKKFIAITMCSVILVLAFIIGSINIAGFRDVDRNADILLEIISENGGTFPRLDDVHKEGKKPRNNISPETPFETRFFTVNIDGSGTAESADTGKIAAVSVEKASEIASELYAKGRTQGYYNTYKYRAVEGSGSTMYIFLDCSRELSTFYSFLAASILISLAGILLVFILVVVLSKLAVNPVYKNYKRQKQFITDAGHELKTPLTIIDANTAIIEMENGESEWTKSIKNQVVRLSELTQNLILLSKADEESAVLHKLDFSLSDAVSEAANPFLSVAQANGKTLNLNIQNNITYCGEEASLRRMISLLLDNAVKYSASDAVINLTLKQSGKSIVLTVDNPVDEIQKGNLDILFERFYRPDASRNSQTGGSGIGLSAARAIINAHNGKIKAESKTGKDIVFTVTL